MSMVLEFLSPNSGKLGTVRSSLSKVLSVPYVNKALGD